MKPYYQDEQVTLYCGDNLEVMSSLAKESISAIVTDPPYGLSFMGKRWDYDVPSVETWRLVLDLLKPGGHLLSFAGTRTQHRMAVNIEDAGFEIRDMIAWVYGSGFPKSLDVSKAIDKAAGARGHDSVGFNVAGKTSGLGVIQRPELRSDHPDYVKPQGITPEAQQWAGWGTALKPALEPITVARKPFKGTVASNVLQHGTGAINVEGCRVGTDDVSSSAVRKPGTLKHGGTNHRPHHDDEPRPTVHGSTSGRWPANLIHDGSDEVVGLFPETKSTKERIGPVGGQNGLYENGHKPSHVGHWPGGSGSAARFFYCAKASKRDRNEGCEGIEEKRPDTRTQTGMGTFDEKGVAKQSNHHPTVKPTDLMAYLCRLVTPPSGLILDPFMGSGSTGKAAVREGFRFIGIEQSEEYCEIALARIKHEIEKKKRDKTLFD